jgi:hypothetical protein
LAVCEETLTRGFCNVQLELQVVMHQSHILISMGKKREGIARGLEALSLFDEGLSSLLDNPENALVYEERLLQEFLKLTHDNGIDHTFNELPILRDKSLLAAHSLLIEMISPTAFVAPHLLHTLPLVGVLMTFKHGKCVQSAFHVGLPD